MEVYFADSPMKRSLELVMFDLDGTLADTGHDLVDAVNFTRGHFNLPPLPAPAVYANVGRGVEHLLKRSLPETGESNFRAIMQVFLERYENHLLDRTVLYPGVVEVLRYFHGKRRAVVSNKMHRLTVAVVQGLGVAAEFDAILGGDSVAEKTSSGDVAVGFAAVPHRARQRVDRRRRRYRYRSGQARRRDHLRRDLWLGQPRRAARCAP